MGSKTEKAKAIVETTVKVAAAVATVGGALISVLGSNKK